eukprot:1660659-Amphidinium_carterae.2
MDLVEEKEFYFATSAVEPPSADSCEDDTGHGGNYMVLPREKSSSGVVLDNTSAIIEQVGTCSAGEVFGVPTMHGKTSSAGVVLDNTSAAFEQVGTCSTGVVFWFTAKAIGSYRFAHTFAQRTRPCQTRNCMHLSLMTKPGFQKRGLLERMQREVPSAATRFCQAPMKMTSLGSCWNPRSASKLLQGVDSPQSQKNGTSTWNGQSAWKRLTQTLRGTLHLIQNGPGERNLARAKQRQGGRARRVESGVTRTNLPTVEGQKACDAFLERIDVAEPDRFKRRGQRARWMRHLQEHSALYVGLQE